MVDKKISVVIPTYNRPVVTKRAIFSALNQKNIGELEVIVVDDGSTDNTREMIEGLNDPRIKYIYQENGGVSKARNTGIRAATGEFIAMLDSDDFLRQFSLAFRAQFLIDNPDYDMVTGSVIELGKNLEISSDLYDSIYPPEALSNRDYKFGMKYDLSNESNIDEFYRKVIDFVKVSGGSIPYVTSSMMFRKQSLIGMDLFNESLRNSEDLEFIVRAAKVLKTKFFFITTFACIQFQDNGLTRNIQYNLMENQLQEVFKILNIQL